MLYSLIKGYWVEEVVDAVVAVVVAAVVHGGGLMILAMVATLSRSESSMRF